MSTVVSFKSKAGSRAGGRQSFAAGPARRGKMGYRKPASVVSRAMSSATRASNKNGSAASVVSTRRRASVNAALGMSGLTSAAAPMSALRACAYWDALINTVPPSLTTTFGSYTCVNSVVRFTYTTAPNTPTQFMFVWNPTANRTFLYEGLLTTTTSARSWAQQQLFAGVNTSPLDIRPLRMSIRACNTTAAVYRGGSVTSALVPQSILQTWSNANTLSAASWASQWGLAQNSPYSKRLSSTELSRSQAFIMPPSSYMAYNQYLDFIPTVTDNGAALSLADFYGLIFYDNTISIGLYPVTPKGGFVGSIPTNNILIINIEPNTLAQTYDFVVSCQDAVRYPANSLPASMAQKFTGNLTSEVLSQHTAQMATANNVHSDDSISNVGSVAGGMLGANLGAAAGASFGPAGAAVGNFLGGMAGSQAGGYLGSRVQRLRG